MYNLSSLHIPSMASLNDSIGLFNILLVVGEEIRTGAIISEAVIVSPGDVCDTGRLGCTLPVTGRLLSGRL